MKELALKAESEAQQTSQAALAAASQTMIEIAAKHPVLWIRAAPCVLRALRVALSLAEASIGNQTAAQSLQQQQQQQLALQSQQMNKMNPITSPRSSCGKVIATANFGRDKRQSWIVQFQSKRTLAKLDEWLWPTVIRCLRRLPVSVVARASQSHSTTGLSSLLKFIVDLMKHRKVA